MLENNNSFIKQFENERMQVCRLVLEVLSASPGLGQNKHVALTLNMTKKEFLLIGSRQTLSNVSVNNTIKIN